MNITLWYYRFRRWMRHAVPIWEGICTWSDWAFWAVAAGIALGFIARGLWKGLPIPAIFAAEVWLLRWWRRRNLRRLLDDLEEDL